MWKDMLDDLLFRGKDLVTGKSPDWVGSSILWFGILGGILVFWIMSHLPP